MNYEDACFFMNEKAILKEIEYAFPQKEWKHPRIIFTLFMFYHFPDDTLYADKPRGTYEPFHHIIRKTVYKFDDV